MANKFQIKRTTVSGRTANTTNASNTSFIDKGELAFNLADRKLYSSDTSNTLFEVGANLTTLSVSSTLSVSGNSTLSGNTIVFSPTIGTLSSTTKALDIYPPSIASSHEARGFAIFRDYYNAGVNGQFLQIKSFSNGTGYGGWHIMSNWSGKLRFGASANNGAEANNYPSSYAEISTTALSTTGLTFSTGNTTITGDLSVTGNTTLGDAAADSITLNANTITIAANSNIDAGTLYIDSLNNRVGFSTNSTNLTDTLVVAGRARIDGTNKLTFGYSSGGYAGIGISGVTTGTLLFTTYDGATVQERMRINYDTGNTGIGNTSPANKLFVTGDIGLDGISVRDTATSTTTATTQVTLFEYPVATYDSCDVIIKAVTGGERHTTKLLVTANSTVAIATEYGILQTGSSLYSVDVDVTSSNTRIRITPASATSTVFKASYELITA